MRLSLYTLTFCHFFNFNENTGDYEIKSECVNKTDDEDRKVAYETLNTGWAMWLRAKRDAKWHVPEGFVLVSKVFPEEKALNLAKQKTEEQSKRVDDKFRHGIEYSENKKASISKDKLGAMKNLHTDFFLMIEELEQKV